MKALVSFSYENQSFKQGEDVNIENEKIVKSLVENGLIGNDENAQKLASQKAEADAKAKSVKAQVEAENEVKAKKVK